ncbi:hypothetical protein [Gracilibacillus sp. Marseille-QA3620]
MKNINFIDWQIELEDKMDAVVDKQARKMIVTEGAIELVAVIWIDDKDVLQLKPTWDSLISIDHTKKILTIRSADVLRTEAEDVE